MRIEASREARGFSLVELLVVVIIIAIIAAIAIPSLLASRRAANEASAVATLRNINSAQTAYFSVVGNNVSYGDLSDLGTAGFVDTLIGGSDTTSKSGFTFNVSLPSGSPFDVYCATGFATDFGQSGSRDFLVSSDAVVYGTSTDGSMSCTDGVPDTTGGAPIQ